MQLPFAFAALVFAMLGAGPVGPASANHDPATEASEAAVKAWLLSATEADGPLNYSLAWVDLNGDGQGEAIVYLTGPSVCGSGGCNMYVLERQRSAFVVRAHTTVTRTPVYVLEARSNGWRDLAVNVCGGGKTTCYQARLGFDGSKYPSNPTTTPPVKNLGIPPVIILPELGSKPLRP